MSTEIILTLCSCPTREKAEEIAHHLVSEGLAACVTITPAATSLYKWEGRLETVSEVLLLIKTSRQSYSEMEQRIVSLHPYEVPEIIALPITHGLDSYLSWVKKCAPHHD